VEQDGNWVEMAVDPPEGYIETARDYCLPDIENSVEGVGGYIVGVVNTF